MGTKIFSLPRLVCCFLSEVFFLSVIFFLLQVVPCFYQLLCFIIVDQLLEGVKQRPRSLSDPVIKQLEEPENTFQQQSLHIVADTERRKRLEAEKKLKKLIAGQSLELRFPELQLYADKSYQDKTAHDGADESDDNSSTTSTLDEGDVFLM